MDYNYPLLIEKFKEISNLGYLPSVNNSTGSIGNTFERALHKKADSGFFPDFHGIEIKTTGRFSNYPVTLFGITFDGPTFPEIFRLIAKYGVPDKDYPGKKVIFAKISTPDYIYLYQNKYYFMLEINYDEEKIYLAVYDKNSHLIEKKSFVYLWSICNHVNTKLQYLALVHASKKRSEESCSFRYYKLDLYRLKSYENFIKQIEKGSFNIEIIARLTKSGKDSSRYRNKGLVFTLKKSYLIECLICIMFVIMMKKKSII